MHKDPDQHRAYMNSYMKERYSKRREATITRLGGSCKNCGSVDELELDHIDPASKFKSIAKLSSASTTIFDAEIKKCQLLCRSCHLEKTISEGSLDNKFRDCPCDSCGRMFSSIKSYAGHKAHCK